MKILAAFIVAIVLFEAVGCALSYRRSTDNDGFDFPSDKVKKIIKGKTTGDEIIHMFGGPFSKSDISENEEEWGYYYSSGVEINENSFLSNYVYATGYRKSLVIRLKNGTVSNFIYTESPHR